MMKKLEIYTDGGSRGNPGPAASACIIFLDGKSIFENSHFLGVRTNNQAEYMGVVLALHWLDKNRKFKRADFFLDSELVVNQLIGRYKIKDEILRSLAERINKKILQLNMTIYFTAIPREKNKIADKMVNEKLDSVLK